MLCSPLLLLPLTISALLSLCYLFKLLDDLFRRTSFKRQELHYHPTQYPSATTTINAQPPTLTHLAQAWTPPMNVSMPQRPIIHSQPNIRDLQYDYSAAYGSSLQYGASSSGQAPYTVPSQSVPTTSSTQPTSQQRQQPLGLSYSDLFPRAAASSTSKSGSNGRRLTKKRR